MDLQRVLEQQPAGHAIDMSWRTCPAGGPAVSVQQVDPSSPGHQVHLGNGQAPMHSVVQLVLLISVTDHERAASKRLVLVVDVADVQKRRRWYLTQRRHMSITTTFRIHTETHVCSEYMYNNMYHSISALTRWSATKESSRDGAEKSPIGATRCSSSPYSSVRRTK